MPRFRGAQAARILTLFAIGPLAIPQMVPAAAAGPPVGSAETLSYSIEWRLIYAGSAKMSLAPKPGGTPEWESKLHIESGGLVSRLYKLDDNYRVDLQDAFCATSSLFDAAEGARKHETKVTFDRGARKATYLERDVLKNQVIKTAETEIPPCVGDILGGLYKVRTMRIEPGQSAQVPVSDGKKTVAAKIEALDREEVITKAGKFNTIRYEAFVFNGVLYKKNARLEMWLTDDGRKLPVQFRARMPFPIGTITFQLEKAERS